MGVAKKRVVIIGSGWSGIYMLKHALEQNLEPVLLEARDHPLGIWHYSRLPGGVLRKTHATSSKVFMHPSDYPFKEDVALFPHHDVIEKHLLNYIKEFGLSPYIKYNQKVTKVSKQNDKWIITTNNQKREADFLVIATGLNNVPNIPQDDIYKKFSGKTLHTHFFNRSLKKELKGKNVLIVGGGETACDIAYILSDDSKVYLSIRNGQWFQDRITGANEAADIFYNRFIHSNFLNKEYGTTIFKDEMEFWWGSGGTGVDIWRPSAKYFNGVYNKSRDIVQKIAQGEIFPRKGVKNIKGNKILFEGNEKWAPIDYILFGTGYNYKKSLNFLPVELVNEEKYKHVFLPLDKTIAFVGFVRPYLGSLPMLSELQTRWIARVFSNKVKLPAQEQMREEIQEDIEDQKRMFPKDSKRMPFLVNPFSYSDEIAKFFGAKPRMWALFLINPRLWWRLLLQAWSPFQYRVNDEDKKKRALALKQIEALEKDPISIKLKRKLFAIATGVLFFVTTASLSTYAIVKLVTA